MNLSCWGRCDEPCGEGAAARVRTPQGRHPPLPRHKRPQGGGRRSCSTTPPPLPHFPGPCLQLLARPPPSLPAPASSSEAEGGGCARSRSSPPHPQAVGVRLKARPWWGAGGALYRASTAPGGGAL